MWAVIDVQSAGGGYLDEAEEKMLKAHWYLLASLLTLLTLAKRADADPPKIAPEGPVWDAAAGFQFDKKADKKRESLSGIACPSLAAVPRLCVAAFDEGIEARYVVIDGYRLIPQPDTIVLLAGGKELDAEGAAHDGDMVYITGSHSPKRGDCAINPDSRHVIRFKVNPSTGRAAPDATGKPAGLEDDRGNLWRLLKASDELGQFAADGKCLGKPDHAVNIEGVAAKNGTLYFGLREPAKDKHTYVVSMSAEQLFSGAGHLEVTKLKVGNGRGIRDLLSVPEGLLLLIGPDDDNSEDAGWSVALWDGQHSREAITPQILADLQLKDVAPQPCKPPGHGEKPEIKPEAFTMLDDGPDFRRLLILSDGMCDGGGMSFKIPK
jgi:hypothetical protein